MNEYHLILLALLLSAFFSGMEIAFVSANKLKFEVDKKTGGFSSRLLARIVHSDSNFISAMLVGNNLALVVYGLSIAIILEPFLHRVLPVGVNTEFSVFLGQTIISSTIILVFAEFLPKVLFRINPNRLFGIFSFPVYIVYLATYPLVVITIGISRFFLKLFFQMDIDDQKRGFDFVDIDNFLREYGEASGTPNDEARDLQLFKNAIEFPDIKVRECMTPRTEIVAVAHTEKPEKIRQVLSKTGHSKVLVYKNSIDNIIGYLHVYDLFKKPKEIAEIIKPLALVPETMLIKKLFDRLIKQKKSIAVVVDEFGGTSGIITIEDIMEEIFGEIDDEHDFESLLERELGQGEYILSARLEIDYLNEKYSFQIPESDEYNTLGGFILNHLETIPKKGQEITIEGLRFRISQVSKKLIEKVLVTVLKES